MLNRLLVENRQLRVEFNKSHGSLWQEVLERTIAFQEFHCQVANDLTAEEPEERRVCFSVGCVRVPDGLQCCTNRSVVAMQSALFGWGIIKW